MADDREERINEASRRQIIAKPPRRAFHRIVAQPGSYQGDIIFFKYSTSKQYIKANGGNTCALVCIEIATRYAYALPMPNKDTEHVISAFNAIYQQAFDDYATIHTLTTDSGVEFNNPTWNALLSERLIVKQFIKEPLDRYSLGILDRFCRTIKDKCEAWQIKNKSLSWVDALGIELTAYNAHYHRTIESTPNFLRSHRETLDQTVRKRIAAAQSSPGTHLFHVIASKFRNNRTRPDGTIEPLIVRVRLRAGEQPRDVGHRARVGRDTKPGNLAKGGERWSNEVYRVTGIIGNSFELETIADATHPSKKTQRTYRAHELFVVPSWSKSVPDIFTAVAKDDRRERRRRHEGLD